MIALSLVFIPAVAALLAALARVRAHGPALMVGVAVSTTLLAFISAVTGDASVELDGFVRVDSTTLLFVSLVNPIFLGVAWYLWNRVADAPSLLSNMPRFTPLALAFLAAANAVLLSAHVVTMWLALEASTLAIAPLIVRPESPSSRRASWRYLLFSTVGLGLALLGLLSLAKAAALGGEHATFFLDTLPGRSGALTSPWAPVGLAITLLGLGTKLGLAPMYTWLPETYDEAPPSVAALLGAVQFNCALVMMFRIVQAYRPAYGALITAELVTVGALSMVVSTLNLIATRNIKRLIAYASVNHAGVIAIGLGVAHGASFGLLLYVISNAFIKATLFLTVGKIKARYRTKDTRLITGLVRDLPYSGIFLMVGTFALLGFPPFASFFGEVLILSALVSAGQPLVFATFCVLITISFVATGRTVFPMIWGESRPHPEWPRQTFLAASPKLAFMAVLVMLGLYIPPAVSALLQQVAASLEGR